MGTIGSSLLSFFKTQQKIQETAASINTLNTLNRLLNNYYANHLSYPSEQVFINQLKMICPSVQKLKPYVNPKCKQNFQGIQNLDAFQHLLQLGWGILPQNNAPQNMLKVLHLDSDCQTALVPN